MHCLQMLNTALFWQFVFSGYRPWMRSASAVWWMLFLAWMKRIQHIPNGICCQGSFCDICALQITLGPTEVTSLYMTQQTRLSPQQSQLTLPFSWCSKWKIYNLKVHQVLGSTCLHLTSCTIFPVPRVTFISKLNFSCLSNCWLLSILLPVENSFSSALTLSVLPDSAYVCGGSLASGFWLWP